MEKKKEILVIFIGFAGAMVGLFVVILFNQYLLMSLPLVVRMLLSIAVYWIPAVVPVIMMFRDRKPLADYGFCKEHIGRQIGIGIVLGLAMSLVFTVIPHLAGFGAYFDSGKRYSFLWQFIYEFVYCIIAVGLTEELVFRGFLYTKIKSVSGTETAAMIGSSVLFGLSHVFSGYFPQIIMTGFLGFLWCLCRKHIKDCSTLSLIIMHGVYDALITVWANYLR